MVTEVVVTVQKRTTKNQRHGFKPHSGAHQKKHDLERWARMDTRICVPESLRGPPETIATLLTGYTPTQNKKFNKKVQLSPVICCEIKCTLHIEITH